VYLVAAKNDKVQFWLPLQLPERVDEQRHALLPVLPVAFTFHIEVQISDVGEIELGDFNRFGKGDEKLPGRRHTRKRDACGRNTFKKFTPVHEHLVRGGLFIPFAVSCGPDSGLAGGCKSDIFSAISQGQKMEYCPGEKKMSS
jgi:hypothetical protein